MLGEEGRVSALVDTRLQVTQESNSSMTQTLCIDRVMIFNPFYSTVLYR